MARVFTVRRLDTAGKPRNGMRRPWIARMRLFRALRRRGKRPFVLHYRRGPNQQLRSRPGLPGDGAWQVSGAAMDLVKSGVERVVVKPSKGPQFVVHAHQERPAPVVNGPGTAPIDRIYAAVHAKFDEQWLVTNLGICANKPGEHHYCNAWDIGVNPNLPADTIHHQIEVMAEWLREQGYQNDRDSNKGLPVNGVIVLYHYWESGCGRYEWRPYHGTPHVSHVHVSGKPSYTGYI